MYTPRSGVVYSQWSMMETVEVASDAYVYFYPVVQNLKNLFQASIWPHSPAFAPLNQFRHSTKLVDWRFTSVVSPNNDTLYSRAWLDLDKTPMILGLPAVPVMDNNKKVPKSPAFVQLHECTIVHSIYMHDMYVA